jgi:hypothetical protein
VRKERFDDREGERNEPKQSLSRRMELEELAIRPYPKSILPFPSLSLPSTTIITAHPARPFLGFPEFIPSESIGHPLPLKSTSRRRHLTVDLHRSLLSTHTQASYALASIDK